jgi:glycyl-tRNA synthetase beta chain
VRSFFRERLEFYLKDARTGYAYDVVSAVLAVDSDDVVDAAARAEAVSKVRGSADFESISSAFKRMKNILRQAAEKTKVIAMRVDPAGLQEESEKELAALIPQPWRRSRNCARRAIMKARCSRSRSCVRRSTNSSTKSW